MKWTVIEKIIETLITVTVRFKPEKPISFLPGQFFMLDAIIDGKKVKRAYSTSSPPTRDYIDVTVKLSKNPVFSKFLHDIKPGDQVDAHGPFGHFTFDESKPDHLVLIGAGSGIAPLMAMTRHVVDKKLPNKITVIYCSKTTEHIIFRHELEKLSAEGKIKLHLTLTQETANGIPEGMHSGRITTELLRSGVVDIKSQLYYLCGPPDMVNGTIRLLVDLGADKNRIKTERYN